MNKTLVDSISSSAESAMSNIDFLLNVEISNLGINTTNSGLFYFTHANSYEARKINLIAFKFNKTKFEILYEATNDLYSGREYGVFKPLIDGGELTIGQVNNFYDNYGQSMIDWLSDINPALDTIWITKVGGINNLGVVDFQIMSRANRSRLYLVLGEIYLYTHRINEDEETINNIPSVIANLESEISTLNTEKSELESNNDTENPRYAVIIEFISMYESQIQEVQSNINVINDRLMGLNAVKSALESEYSTLINMNTNNADQHIVDSARYTDAFFGNRIPAHLTSIYDAFESLSGYLPTHFNLIGIEAL
jgi:hypothetical protein